MKYVICIATFVAILFYCLSAPPAAGVPWPGEQDLDLGDEYTKMYLQERANLVHHTWTRIGNKRYEPVAVIGFLEIQNN